MSPTNPPSGPHTRCFAAGEDECTARYVRAALSYDLGSGELTWAQGVVSRRVKAGQVAGSIDKERGYLFVGIRGRNYRAHRLAWLLATGNWPVGVIDHINGNRLDNRFANLRDTTADANRQNRSKASRHSRTGLLGVCVSGNRFQARIQVNGTWMHLGSFATAEEAHEAYMREKCVVHPGATVPFFDRPSLTTTLNKVANE